MKKILFILFVSTCTLSAQNYLPVPGEGEDCLICPPNRSAGKINTAFGHLADGMTEVAKALRNPDCNSSNAPWQCWLGDAVADLLPCMYHPSTPQGGLCEEGDQPDNDQPQEPNPQEPNPQEPAPNDPPQDPPKPDENTPQNEHLYVNPSAKVYAWSWGDSQFKNSKGKLTKESLIKEVSQMADGTVVGRNKYGYTLVKHSAYYSSKTRKDIIFFLTLKNKKGQTIGNPTIVTTDKKLYMVDMASKTKQWLKK